MEHPQQHRYEIIGTIGTGATSRVDKARDSMIGRTVALKTFLRELTSGDMQKQFLREAQIIGRLSHPFIVGLYDVGINQDGFPYLVMEYVEGKTLETTLDGGRLPLERAALWAADLASALARAHQAKVIHGDVKPANVLVTRDGQVKLGDFGIARFATQISGSGNILGTPAYLSPEQILGHQQDCRSDLFSLGIMLYQMTTGVRPFDGTSVGAVCAQIISAEPLPPSHYNKELPPAFDHVVMRCLAKNPADRYATADALGASLYPFTAGSAAVGPSPYRSWWDRPMQAGDLRMAAGVLAILAIAGVGVRVAWRRSSDDLARVPAPRQASGAPAPSAFFGAEPSDGIINVSTVDVVPSEQRLILPLGAESPDAHSAAPASNLSPLFPRALTHDPSAGSPFVSHTFASHSVAPTKPKPLHMDANSDSAGVSSATASRSFSRPGTAAAPANGPDTSATARLLLHVDVLSTVSDEVISVFADDELLLSTPLQAGHVGDTMRFDCPLARGEHVFRVVLTRSDASMLVQKENSSQISASSSNFMGIHVTRHAKLLLKHEPSLEVVWPSTIAPGAASIAAHAESAVAMR